MAVTRVNSSIYQAPSSGGLVTTRTITVPSGVADGDTIVLGLVKTGGSSAGTATGLTGLNLVADHLFTGHGSSLYVKQNASASDAGMVITITTSTALRAAAVIGVYRGVASVSPLDAYTIQDGNPATNCTAPAATSTVNDVRLDFALATGNNASVTFTAAGGMTKVAEAVDQATTGGGYNFAALFESLTNIGPSTTTGANAYVGSAATINAGWTLLLKAKTASASVVPISQVSNAGSWVPNGAADNVSALADASDSTSADTPANPTNASLVVGLDSLTSGQVSVTTRARYQSGGSGSVTTVLKQGATVIATWTDPLTTSYVDYVHTTTSGQTAAITDFTALSVELKGTSA